MHFICLILRWEKAQHSWYKVQEQAKPEVMVLDVKTMVKFWSYQQVHTVISCAENMLYLDSSYKFRKT